MIANKRNDGKPEGDERNDVADLGEAPKIVGGHNFLSPDLFAVPIPLPEYRYFHAVDRPGMGGTVGECLYYGYEVDKTQKSNAPGHVLMRIPIEKWRERQAAERAVTEASLTDVGVKGGAPVRRDPNHGAMSGRRSH